MANKSSAQMWSSSLLGCFEDCAICLYGYCLLPCLYGENYAKFHDTGCCGPCLLYFCCPMCACFFAGTLRGDIRAKYNLPEEPCSDCCVHCFCSSCASCQEAREIRVRAHMAAPASRF